MENIGGALRGMYRDTLFDSVGRLIFDSGWIHNTIVKNGRILLASLMKGEDVGGIYCMKVGKGLAEWDNKPEEASDTDTDLTMPYTSPINIIPEQDIFYLDEITNYKTSIPTSRLEIRVVMKPNFPESNLTSELREFGLFSKDLNMINCVRHPLIQKAASETLIRVVQLFF